MARSVLIVKLAAIGDVVMALPMVVALKAQDSEVRVDWMCGRIVEPLLRNVEGIDEVIPVDEASLLVGSPWRKSVALVRAWIAVAGRRYDHVYVAHSDARYRVLAWPVRASHRHWLGGESGARGIVPGRCHPDEYVRMVSHLDDQRAKRQRPPRVTTNLPGALATDLAIANPTSRPLVALTPGGARNVARDVPLRRWPLERYAELAKRLDEAGYAVVITGEASDSWVRSAFWGVPVIDAIGRTDLPSLLALFRECTAVVAHDSGPMHIAGLAGSRVIALLGPTPPTMFFRPDDEVRVLWPGGSLPCAPCYDGVEFAACSKNVCMQMIGVRDVVEQLGSTAVASRATAAAPIATASAMRLEQARDAGA